MRLAISDDSSTLSKIETVSTPQVYEKGVELFVATARQLINSLTTVGSSSKLDLVVGGLAGTIDHKNSLIQSAPNLKNWEGKNFSLDVETTFAGVGIYDVSVNLQNDASMAALGEALSGAGRGFSIVAYITVGTGVGGARIALGELDPSTLGFEPGHQIIDIDKTVVANTSNAAGVDHFGNTLEDCISGAAIEKISGKKPKEIKDPNFWDGLARILAFGLTNTVVHWSPDVIVLGGSMITGDPAIPIDAIEKHLQEILKIYPRLPSIKKAELGDHGGLFGALEYARQINHVNHAVS